jgi:heterodisulfide reductase subunit A-like polyferredoxin
VEYFSFGVGQNKVPHSRQLGQRAIEQTYPKLRIKIPIMSEINFQKLNAGLDYDVLIIGAGLSGIYSLIRMRKLGLRVRILEAGTAEGGTWFW